MPYKLTDNEIIKALECCLIKEYIVAYYDDEEIIVSDILNLIKRQQAEIIRLKNKNSKVRNERNRARAKAIKEFAERLETRCYPWETYGHFHSLVTSEECIDNLVKEMVGDDK